MKISHEVPLCILEDSRELCDYDYALVHLFEQFPTYYEYFKESLKQGRTVLLDNSLFELETMFDSDEFAKWICKLEPTEYIVPDALEDMNATIDSFDNWLKDYEDLPGVKIGVVQGKTYEELVLCYRYMSHHADKIAISFDYSYYEKQFPIEENKYFSWMKGRIELINRLISDGFIDKTKPHHLLGCSLPVEGIAYKGLKFFESVDTSNPVVHAIKGKKYNPLGLMNKESIKLVDLFKTCKNEIDERKMLENLITFRRLWGDK